jgi:hypothetical protein
MVPSYANAKFEWLYWNISVERLLFGAGRRSDSASGFPPCYQFIGRGNAVLVTPTVSLLLVFITPSLRFCFSNALLFLLVVHLLLLYSRLLIFICVEASVTAQNIFLLFPALISNEFANYITLSIVLANDSIGGYEIPTAVVMKNSLESQPTFRRKISPSSSGPKTKPNKKPAWKLYFSPAFTLVSCTSYSSTLKMEATCSSELSVDFGRTTRRYIPRNRTLR